MNDQRMEVLKQVISSRWKVDVEAGTVRTRLGLAKTVDENGYGRVVAKVDGQYYPYLLHEVIAVAGGLDIRGKRVKHIDGNKSNCSIHNLKAVELNRKGEEHGRAKLSEAQVIEIKQALKDHKHGMSKQLAFKYGVTQANISAIRRGILWSHVTA